MKIYDCFCFFNEIETLELRMKTLNHLVDYFVIVEGNKTHQGEPRELIFKDHIQHFAQYKDKIRYLVFDSDYVQTKPNDYKLYNDSLDLLRQGLFDADDEDLILLSDLDEIPNPQLLEKIKNKEKDYSIIKPHRILRKNKSLSKIWDFIKLISHKDKIDYSPLVFHQKHSYYFINNLSKDLWCGSIIVKKKNLPSKLHTLRDNRRRLPIIENGGWHLAYMGGVERILQKINSTVDEGKDRDTIKKYTKEDVINAIKQGSMIYDFQNHEKDIFKIYNIADLDMFYKEYPHYFIEN